MKLTSENVSEVFRKCLFNDNENVHNHIEGRGVMFRIGFHPGRLSESVNEIEQLLDQLPNEFKKNGGGGMSFLNACVDKDGNHWGEHQNIDELLCLGLASRKVKYCMPRNMWDMLPGGMPYFVVV